MILLDSSIRAAVVAGLVALLLATLRVRTSSVRHAAWTAVLGAMLLMPVLSHLVPPIGVRVPLPMPAPAATRPADIVPGPQPGPSAAIHHSAEFSPAAGPTAVRRLPAQPAPPRAISPARLVLGVYAVVCVVLFSRVAIGWRRASALARRSARVGDFFFESPLVAAPVTIGVIAARIVLPPSWRDWSSDTLRAVLVHERTHVRRWDPLVGLVARLNCCLFWFHPLAWWLNRTLAATAEHACDDAAAREMRDARSYASVLVEQADAVRRSGGRLVWHGIGMNGAGLHQRVNRLLEASHLIEMSRRRKLAVAVSCAVAIFVVAACRQQILPSPLREDPEVARSLAEQKMNREFTNAARALTVQQVGALEDSLQKNPEDLDARKKLLHYYRWSGKVRWEDMIAARRRHLLWLIEHHPEHQLTSEWGPISPIHDPEGYADARSLWLRKTSGPETSVEVLNRAATYFAAHDKALAEQMLLRAMAMDPQSRTLPSGSFPWPYRLGTLYARAIVGSVDDTTRKTDPAEARTPFALEARKKLDASRDARVLTTAGSYLVYVHEAKLDFEPVALGRSYLELALQIDPQSSQARVVLADLQQRAASESLRQKIRARQIRLVGGEIAAKAHAGKQLSDLEQQALSELEDDAAVALTAPERFAVLPQLADEAYMRAEAVEFARKDRPRAEALWAQSKQYAREALTLAEKFKTDPNYGTVIYRSKVALAAHALREGDKAAAVRYMLEASAAPRSEQLATVRLFALDHRLVNYLLKEGERESVSTFLERSADLRDVDRERLLKDAAAIRQGVMPMSYQATVHRAGS